ncbi:FAD binding domain-containing protein [Mycotypha africana]|uniref:FAD binding domain-containing protein n=1 Tax=Mycotypha africana TaxID=64632 RepID=UPI002301297E|nr:FAD binding domain-containing protein [Mycotypha africana]KAI8975501.1 FAD binding domain-containing protein [Mycotypha africana]
MVRLNPMKSTDKDRHVFRIFGNLEAYKHEKDSDNISHGLQKQEDPLSLDFFQKWVDEMAAPFKFELKDLIWSSNFRINERIANSFRRGRAFLIGDSAHCHSPFGGQGMNMGLQDADNLAWKLSYVLRGIATDSERLLDSYNAEREPRVKATIKATSVSTETATSASPLMASMRFALMSMILKIPQIRTKIYKTVMQQDITIDPKIEGCILGTSDKSLIQPGQFLPDTGNLRPVLIQHNGALQRKTLREILIGQQNLSAIYIGTCPGASTPNRELLEKFWIATRRYSKCIHRLVIQSLWYSHLSNTLPEFVSEDEKLSEQNSFWCEERIDNPISLTNRVGLYSWLMSYTASAIAPAVILIVRPDLYVVQARLVSNENELNSALAYFTTIIT